MKIKVQPFLYLLLLLALVACGQNPAGDLHRTTRQLPLVPTSPGPTVTPVPTGSPETTVAAAASPTALVPTPSPAATSPAGGGPHALLSPAALAAERLSAAQPLLRDDLLLAQTYQGLTAVSTPPPRTFSPGDRDTLSILNYQDNSSTTIEAILLAMGEHAYFWFDTDTAAAQLPAEQLAETVTAFDGIYAQLTTHFGDIADPGIDGDPRVHIVHAAPSALCGSAGGCGLAGYYSADNALPRAVNPNSNERDMFVMNVEQFGTSGYLSVLAHEFRHLIEAEYSEQEADWAVEGSAVLAEELAGWPEGAYATGNGYLADPDLQLNRWSGTNTFRHYGQGYVLSRYLYTQLGPAGYRALAAHPAIGLEALDALKESGQADRTGEQFWRDWLVAMAMHNRPDVPREYDLGDVAMDTVGMTTVPSIPATYTTTVNQYATDYYRLPAGTAMTLTFTGSSTVPVLDTTPPSGRQMWVSGRANFSESRLTRAFDLRAVDQAKLEYSLFHDIEAGFDFAYLFVSADGGATWTPLTAPGMQDRRADPGRVALADAFYTGRSAGWLRETVDLTPYAGQEILLRFSYVTDPVLTEQGLALDDIAIPEIGFFDDVESEDNGWVAEGFVPVTDTLPQQWHVQLILPGDGVPQVLPLPLNENGTIVHAVPATTDNAILIVAATAPMTLQPAGYTLAID